VHGQQGQQAQPGEPSFEQQEHGYAPTSGVQSDSSSNRMLLVAGGALALAVIAVVVLLRVVTGGSGPERVAENWFHAAADEDCGTLERLSTDDLLDSLEPLCSEDDLLVDRVAIEIVGSTLTNEGDDTATVELTLRIRVAGKPEDSEEQDSVVELVKRDGDWKVSSAS
jgi:hypothetical protein